LSFINELQRRNVFRVAIVYTITAWVIAQVTELAADSFLAPDWVMKMTITVLILGLPVSLIMAWAFELTPAGLRRESGAEPVTPTTPARTNKFDRSIIIALLLALAYIAFDKLVLDAQREVALPGIDKQQSSQDLHSQAQLEESPNTDHQSIAVLPFVNMSEEVGNEYFAEGLSEELLNLLVKIPELRVAARTSSFSYSGISL